MANLLVPISSRDHALGPENAPLTLVAYGDLQCPHCRLVQPIITEVAGELKDSLRMAFRHFPITQNHPYAQLAAEALEAAGSQGKFWEMMELIYRDDAPMDRDALCRTAKKAGVNLKQFTRDLDGEVYRDRVRADYLSGVRAGVKGTPTIFINGERYTGAYEFDALVTAFLLASRRV
jgi:protein-disulfide isomerase